MNAVNKAAAVVIYLDQQDAPEKMQDTREVWDYLKNGKYDVYISDVVLDEIGHCSESKQKILLSYLKQINYTVLRIDENTVELAEKFIDFGVLKRKSYDDCRHIASAILAGCDVIVSWNFKHIVNIKTMRGIKVITTLEGYKDILIYPPSALLEEDHDG